MDKPKINLRAWEPINERNKSENLLKEKLYNNVKGVKNDLKKTYSNDKYYHENKIQSKNKAPNYYEYKFTGYKKKPKYHIDIDDIISNKLKKKIRRNSPRKYLNINILKVIIAGIGAIATGMIFGYILLNYFVNSIFTEEQAQVNITNNLNTNNVANNDLQVNLSQKTIPAQSIYLIQAGVFNERTGAELIISEQRSMGRNGLIVGNGPYYVFLGMGINKEDAVTIKESISMGTDLYVKEYNIPEYQGSYSNSSFENFSKFILSGEEIVQTLSEESAQAIANKDFNIDYDKILKLHQQFLVDAQETKNKLNQEELMEEEEAIQFLKDQINYAIAALNSYKKSSDQQYLWSVQENLIKYKFKYNELAVN